MPSNMLSDELVLLRVCQKELLLFLLQATSNIGPGPSSGLSIRTLTFTTLQVGAPAMFWGRKRLRLLAGFNEPDAVAVIGSLIN